MRTITTLSLSLLSFLILLIGQIHAICSWNPSATNCTSLVGRGISLEASQYANYYLRHRTLDKTLDPPNSVWVDLYPPLVPNGNYLYNSGILTSPLLLDDTCFQIVSGLCARVDTPTYNTAIGLNDASFKVVAGLCGIANTMSFQSVDPPGYYLRQQNFYLYVQPLASDDGYKNDACFFQQPPLTPGNSSYFSFESVSYPGYFITQQNSRGMIALNPGPNGTWITTGPINSPPIV